MEEEIMSIIDLLRDEFGEKEAINQVLNIIGKRLAKDGVIMADAMDIAETEVTKGWQNHEYNLGETNEEI